MRRFQTAALGLLLAASTLHGANPKECLDLSAQEDRDTHSPSGILVTVNGYNHCSQDLDGGQCHFLVTAVGDGAATIGKQSGRFGGTVAPYARVETKVFVVCDPERVRSLKVEAQ